MKEKAFFFIHQKTNKINCNYRIKLDQFQTRDDRSPMKSENGSDVPMSAHYFFICQDLSCIPEWACPLESVFESLSTKQISSVCKSPGICKPTGQCLSFRNMGDIGKEVLGMGIQNFLCTEDNSRKFRA